METFSALPAICAGITGEFPPQRPVMRSFDVFFDLRLNKRLGKQAWGWWLRRHHAHYDVTVMLYLYVYLLYLYVYLLTAYTIYVYVNMSVLCGVNFLAEAAETYVIQYGMNFGSIADNCDI